MRLKNYFIVASAASLLVFASIAANNSGFGHKSDITFEENDSEEARESKSPGEAFEFISEMKVNQVTGDIDPQWIDAAYAQMNKNRVSGRLNRKVIWENMGPDNVGGRTRAFLMHRDSANLMFVGSVSGGLFRSNTTGQSWTPILSTDKNRNLNVTCIAQWPDGTIFYGTGEGGFTNLSGTRNGSPAFNGNGVYKSTDSRGITFNRIPSTSNMTSCCAMVAHPSQNVVWVAALNGIFRSTDGTSFTQVRSGSWLDMAIDKNGIVWASSGGGTVIKGNADGTNFTIVRTGSGRSSIGISPENPDYVYVLAANSSNTTDGLYRTVNGGSTWETLFLKNSSNDLLTGGANQGYYNNVIGVDPLNKNKVWMGGVPMAVWDDVLGYREIGSQFDAPWNSGYVHADKHIIQFDMRTKPFTIIYGTDGGLYFSQNGSTWTPRNRGFTTLQLYNVAANEKGHIAGGSQDNGTQLINYSGNSKNGALSKTAIEIYGGDGFDVEFSKIFSNVIFVSTYYGTVARTANGGQSTATFWDERQDGTVRTDFNTTFTLWENLVDSSSKFFLAKNAEVWVAINATDFANPVNWFRVAAGLGTDRIVEMDHTPDGDHLFIAKAGRVYRLDSLQKPNYDINIWTANSIPTDITVATITPPGTSARAITSVNVDQMNANHVVVTLGNYGNSTYVYETNNALDNTPTWKNITGDLPLIPVYDAVIDVDDPKRIILATEFGVFITENGGTNWEEANDGMERVPVYEIRGYEWRSWEGMTMYLGTHGRGYYKSASLLTGVKKLNTTNAVTTTAYPNPASDKVNVVFQASSRQNIKAELFSINGALISTKNLIAQPGQNTFSMDLNGLKAGYYFAKISGTDGIGTVKFIKQ